MALEMHPLFVVIPVVLLLDQTPLPAATFAANRHLYVDSSRTYLAQAAAQNTGRSIAPWLAELNLSAEQVQQVQAISRQSQSQLVEHRQRLRQAQEQLRLLLEGAASNAQVRNQHRQVQLLRQQVSDLQFERLLSIREVLTPEQRRQFAVQMRNRRQQARKQPRRPPDAYEGLGL
jgi:Spy/CpxP family protein refolding chaperone